MMKRNVLIFLFINFLNLTYGQESADEKIANDIQLLCAFNCATNQEVLTRSYLESNSQFENFLSFYIVFKVKEKKIRRFNIEYDFENGLNFLNNFSLDKFVECISKCDNGSLLLSDQRYDWLFLVVNEEYWNSMSNKEKEFFKNTLQKSYVDKPDRKVNINLIINNFTKY